MNWVTLEITGENGVKFMNICAYRNIPVKDISGISENKYRISIPVKEYRKNGKRIAKKAGCKVHVVKKSGAGITMFRYRRRLVLWIGLPLLFLLVFYFNSVIWRIEIIGAEEYDRAVTRNVLMEENIRPGSFFFSFDNRELADFLLRKQQDNLCWVGVHRNGTILEIELAAGKFYEGDPDIPLDTACNIVAGKDGVITKVLTTAGTNMVKVGDVVKKDQLLISGTVVLNDQIITGRPEVTTHAIGEVYAIVKYSRSVPIEKSIVKKLQTGREKKEYVLHLPGFSLSQPFFKGTDFNEYDTVYKDSFINGPFGIREITYIETENITTKLTEEQAAFYAEEQAVSMINDDIPEDAVVLNTTVTIKDSFVVAEAECVENIGVLKPVEG